MNSVATAVRLRDEPGLVARVVHGDPVRSVANRVAVFNPGQLVGYMIASSEHTHTFVFRTLHGSDHRGAKIPGVEPRVALLVDVRGARAASRLRNMFGYFRRHRIAGDRLSAEFWVRVDALLACRLRPGSRGQLLSLLRHESIA
jgi:hypothetical protein